MGSDHSFSPSQSSGFRTTRWSIVRACQADSDTSHRKAVEELCEIYWYPVYAFIRRKGKPAQDAQELTQAFFLQVLEKGFFERAEPTQGKLRSFLMKSVSNFLISDFRRSPAAKGIKLESLNFVEGEQKYSVDASTDETAEKLFERRWATTLIEGVFEKLSSNTAGKFGTEQANLLIAQLRGTSPAVSLQVLAEQLGISEPALKVRMHRLRQKYRELLRSEVAETIGPEQDVDEEIAALIELL